MILDGIRVIELAGLAPAPFASLLLADHGASVLRIDRAHPQAYTSTPPSPTPDPLTRRKSSITLDLKDPRARALLTSLLPHVDILIDPFRPGVLESLGLSPPHLLSSHPRLIVARLSGFRRDGKYAMMAGHDINYLAVSGVLSMLGRQGAPPYAPVNILADFAGGGLMCALGMIMALYAREKTGRGQMVEANMVDGVGYLGTWGRYMSKTTLGNGERGANMLDGGCPWYDVYECKDGGFMAVGALEERFFEEFVAELGVRDELKHLRREDRATWPAMKDVFRTRFLTKSRRQWETVFDRKDACCTPVLGLKELEKDGYEVRGPVGLSETPSKAVDQEKAWTSRGLVPGFGGEKVLQEWVGWRMERDYEVRGGGLVKTDAAKL